MILFFLLVLLSGATLAGLSAKAFADSRKGSSFLGITLAAPGPAIGGMVIGVIVIVCGLIVYLGLSSRAAGLSEQLTAKKGELTTCQGSLEVARTSLAKREEDLEKQKEALTARTADVNDLTKQLAAKESTGAEATAEVDRKKKELDSVLQRLRDKEKEVQDYAARVGIAENDAEVAKKKVEQTRTEIEQERQFRRDFMAVFEEFEALESTYAGTALKMYRQLRDLRNKYK
jgi:chromosome segregation ATPase